MARRESKDNTKGQKTNAHSGTKNNRARNRGYKTAERERRGRSDRKHLCRPGRHYGIVPHTGAVGGENGGGRGQRR
ncbi:MAG: hypothetical protein OXG35_27290 [Acidobacteria bacterium]|nr:hypothetical protein [Acidobacteriota bacterium]